MNTPEFNGHIEFGVGLTMTSMDSPTDLNLFIDGEFVASWDAEGVGGIFINKTVEQRVYAIMRKVAEVAYKNGREDLQKSLRSMLGVKS